MLFLEIFYNATVVYLRSRLPSSAAQPTNEYGHTNAALMHRKHINMQTIKFNTFTIEGSKSEENPALIHSRHELPSLYKFC